MTRPVLLTVAGRVAPDLSDSVASGARPRVDYLEMAAVCDADLADHQVAMVNAGLLGRPLGRLAGANVLLALYCVRRRKLHAAIITDGEGVGLPFAALSRLMPKRGRHIMIGHRLSPTKKVLAHRILRLRPRIDHVVVYSSSQRDVAVGRLGYPPDHVTLMPFMVDTSFWRPELAEDSKRARPMICSAGRELRDYRTLAEAVRGLDVDVVLAAASPWSKRSDSTDGLQLPDNVSVTSLGPAELRQLYADAAFVVVPVVETDFQAGITTILEAMSMERAVITTRTTGQTDTVVDGVTGLYVPPGDVAALRAAIMRLVDDREQAARLGRSGRRWVEDNADIERYARRFAALIGPEAIP